MRLVILSLVLIVFLFNGCKKIIDIDTNYIGQWRGRAPGVEYSLDISEDGHGVYRRQINVTGLYDEAFIGKVRSNGKRFKMGFQGPWFFILENPALITDDITWLFNNPIYQNNNWRIKFRYPNTIGYDGAEVTMYRMKL